MKKKKIIVLSLLIISGLIVFFIDADLEEHQKLYRFWDWVER